MAVSVTVNKDSTIGAILIGALISSFLFGILSIQVRHLTNQCQFLLTPYRQVKYYFSTYGNDPRWMKVMVGLVWYVIHLGLGWSDISHDNISLRAIDFAHQLSATAMSYDHTVRTWTISLLRKLLISISDCQVSRSFVSASCIVVNSIDFSTLNVIMHWTFLLCRSFPVSRHTSVDNPL